ncbi:hypothetical protein PLICRDRAFT_177900 [Plicaturopsis crispa FD-325 SS-3]|nr:hypothetical protein PLICRDRAFT_177900 [Plicaturopsis crispa FD-325 SS-3]
MKETISPLAPVGARRHPHPTTSTTSARLGPRLRAAAPTPLTPRHPVLRRARKDRTTTAAQQQPATTHTAAPRSRWQAAPPPSGLPASAGCATTSQLVVVQRTTLSRAYRPAPPRRAPAPPPRLASQPRTAQVRSGPPRVSRKPQRLPSRRTTPAGAPAVPCSATTALPHRSSGAAPLRGWQHWSPGVVPRGTTLGDGPRRLGPAHATSAPHTAVPTLALCATSHGGVPPGPVQAHCPYGDRIPLISGMQCALARTLPVPLP